ncbi:hypothetical protein GCM10027568_09620 [Humibacter soli]
MRAQTELLHFARDGVCSVGEDRGREPVCTELVCEVEKYRIGRKRLTPPFLCRLRVAEVLRDALDPLSTSDPTCSGFFNQWAAEREMLDYAGRDTVLVLDSGNVARIEVAHHAVEVEEDNANHLFILPRLRCPTADPSASSK